ncbi:hypothetical protein D3C72_649180 [compost metagenome]
MADKQYPDNDRYGRTHETPLDTRITEDQDREIHPGTRIHVEPNEEHKRGALWPWLLGLLIVGLVALPFLNRKPAQQAAVPPAGGGGGTVGHVGTKSVGPAMVYQGRTYVGAGQPQTLDPNGLKAVGRTNGGSTVYQNQGGGGGMAGSTFYVRRADGTFQALAPYNP